MRRPSGFLLVVATVATVSTGLSEGYAEPVLTMGLQRWVPDIGDLAASPSQQGGNADHFDRRSAIQPHLGLRVPFCCGLLDASYDFFGGESALTGADLDLHDVGVGLGITGDPFKMTVQASVGVDLVFLRQKGSVISPSNRTATANDWGWRLALGATYEPVPRWGLDLRWLRRFALMPEVEGIDYDLSGWQFSVGISHFLR